MGNQKAKLSSLPEISQLSGIAFHTLNYYTNLGLLSIADRRGNKRMFVESEALQRLKEIQRLRREGYPLRMIRRQLAGFNLP